MRRLVLVGSLTFAAAWFAVVKLRLLEGTATSIAFGAALLFLAVAAVIAWTRRARPGSSYVREAEAKLRAGDVSGAIDLCKQCLASVPSHVDRAEAECLLATCAAFELHGEEAEVLAEMAEASLANDHGLRADRKAVAARISATLAFARVVRGDKPPDVAEPTDREAGLVVARAKLIAAEEEIARREAAQKLEARYADIMTPFDRALVARLQGRDLLPDETEVVQHFIQWVTSARSTS